MSAVTTTNVVVIIGVAVSCATALLVGHLHRKQLRQIELFRKDPNVGIQPPPSVPVAFLGRHWTLIVGVFFPLGGIGLVLISQPFTQLSSVLVLVNVACIFNYMLARAEQQLLELHRGHIEIARDMTSLLKDVKHEVDGLRQRMDTLESSGSEPQKR